MNFNLGPAKQAQEVIFTRKTEKQNHPPLFFNQSSVIQTISMVQDIQHDFKEDLQNTLKKISR